MQKIRGLMDGEIYNIMRGKGVDGRSVGTIKTAIIPSFSQNIITEKNKQANNMSPAITNK